MLEGLIVAAVRFKDQPWIDDLYELLVSRPDIYKYKGTRHSLPTRVRRCSSELRSRAFAARCINRA